ncbi:hypothetical protein AAFC00_005114 [Neodothiora populina]|uniref:Uncharacterized protein n=1 Tax=Neodothiora populina TaxID=2781224 RepID=A0ABR3PJU0_9PEZI
MRSASVALAQKNCITGYGSVQSAFKIT